MLQAGAMRLLAHFYDKETASFAELCRSVDYPTDLGGYYIRQLVATGYIEKADRGKYRLLPKGKQELTRYYGRRMTRTQPRLAVLIVANRQGSHVIIQRKIQPFIGIAEWPAGMVVGGETLSGAAARIAKERFELEPELQLKGFFRRIDMYENIIFDDKLFAVHSCEIPPEAELAEETRIGRISTYTTDALQKLDRPSRSLIDILNFANANQTYAEKIYRLDPSDLSSFAEI